MDNADEIVATLIELKFFKFTPVAELNQGIEALRASLRDDGILDTYDFRRDRFAPFQPLSLLPYDRRIYFADAEDLAEGGVCELLQLVSPVLEAEGVHFPSLREAMNADRNAYSIFLGEREYVIYGAHETNDAWRLAHQRTVRILNELLGAAGSKERAYGLAEGNEAQIALLSDELFAYIGALPLKAWRI